MAGHYQSANSSDPDFVPGRKRVTPWVKFGVPLAIVAIIGAVLGGVLGTQIHKSSTTVHGSSTSKSLSPQASSSVVAAASSSLLSIKEFDRLPSSTDSYGLPVYPTATNPALYTTPQFVQENAPAAWPQETFRPSAPSVTNVRPDRPRLIAPAPKWAALPSLIPLDAYLKGWNDTIFSNAAGVLNVSPKAFYLDGGSGALDIAREVKERIKNLAYAYRMSNNSVYAERVWVELQNAAGNGTTAFGTSGDNWNTAHFLDTAEFTAAFAIGYDWLYDYWSPTRRTQIMWSILNLGLKFGVQAYTDTSVSFGWWRTVNGNWNCVCNSGLAMGALAVLNDDPTGTASQILNLVVDNAKGNCAQGPSSDGTWSETANYWYFGTTGHAEMASSLITATGSAYGLLDVNPNFNLTGLYHMYVTGMTSLFNYGDHGPNKFSTTANSMMFYGSQYNAPAYTLFQRDRIDAGEPHGLFWYDPTASGAWWDNLSLDHYFENSTDQWASMRTSWTDNTGLYVAIKAGTNSGHQTHNDLDGGDFVLDAMGQRWAGELGSGDYLSTGYFVGDAADSQRWLYYRKRTEGQNTIVVNQQNQVLTAFPTVNFSSSGTTQGSSTVEIIPSDSTAFFAADLTATYGGTSVRRGLRLINGRKQVLLQDDISNSATSVQWRMHTNASVVINTAGTTATLTLASKVVQVQLLNAPSGINFTTAQPVRYPSDPPLPPNQVDQPNPGVTVLVINVPAGTNSIQVLFNPQWSGMSANSFVTPKSVPVDSWSLTSHN
ncbi:hypothetical protein BS47DRAFT_1381662 [Hydnum rufescens UP504]|uniref:Heparinase II/III-like C-terminal domain-containing protein n=1 Tax=Hydnum rufescens UP504 TaxID=1448309 RepID=A0A9P6B0C8_9AGAM|nr:hypothetical protein BS47DRAFT_1381662 [Hydnum rufescens UP504]